MFKRNMLLISVLVLALSLSGCFGIFGSDDPAKIVVNKTSVELDLDENKTADLTVVIKTKKDKDLLVEDKDITWSIANAVVEPSEAGTDNGATDPVATLSAETGDKVTVTAKSIGNAVVTVKYGDLQPVKIEVAVVEEAVTPEPGDENGEKEVTIIWKETFDNVPDKSNLRPKEGEQVEGLDNPESVIRANTSGTSHINDGIVQWRAQRVTFIIPNLSDASNPILKVIAKIGPMDNDEKTLDEEAITLNVLNAHDNGSPEHGEMTIVGTDFQEYELELDSDLLSTNELRLRPSRDGLYVDEIIIYEKNN